MTLKEKIYNSCISLLDEKIISLKSSLQDLEDGSENDAKSSAGDKHETARAMMQIEQEKMGKQLNEALDQKSILEKIDITINSSQVNKGSLVKTNKGYLFLSVAIGKISIDEENVIVLSPQSPLGINLMGLKVNDATQINDTNYIIEGIA
jgi:transcription elongation GreA/GreB family factor